MANFKFKRNGDIKMNITREQFTTLFAILQHTSIFDETEEGKQMNSLMDTLEEFTEAEISASCLNEEIEAKYEKVKFYTSKHCQTISFE